MIATIFAYKKHGMIAKVLTRATLNFNYDGALETSLYFVSFSKSFIASFIEGLFSVSTVSIAFIKG